MIYFKALRIFVYWFEPVSQVSDVAHKPLVLTYVLVIWLSKVNGYLNVTYIILDLDVFLIQLSNQYSCLIWTTSPTKAKYLKDLEDDSFVDAVNDAFVSVARIYSHLRQYRFHIVVFGNTCTMYILIYSWYTVMWWKYICLWTWEKSRYVYICDKFF